MFTPTVLLMLYYSCLFPTISSSRLQVCLLSYLQYWIQWWGDHGYSVTTWCLPGMFWPRLQLFNLLHTNSSYLESPIICSVLWFSLITCLLSSHHSTLPCHNFFPILICLWPFLLFLFKENSFFTYCLTVTVLHGFICKSYLSLLCIFGFLTKTQDITTWFFLVTMLIYSTPTRATCPTF